MVVIKEVENDSTRKAIGSWSKVRFLSAARVYGNQTHAVSAIPSSVFSSAVPTSRNWVAFYARGV
jgi:hypothetical protein